MDEQGSSLECRDHPGQQAQDTGEQQGGHGQFQGRREKGGEFGPHAGTGTQRFAKVALGERGPVWWDDGAPDLNRRMARNTVYADWFAALDGGDA